MKGLALATGKPIIGISSLEVLAHQAGGPSNLVCPVIDARRKELYWRLYRRNGDTLAPMASEQVGSVDQLAAQIDEACMFIGNVASPYRSQILDLVKHEIHWAPPRDDVIRPAVLAQLAWHRYQLGRMDDVGTFVPVYIRKSDAERMRKGSV